jgi:hypothetical protein
MRESKDRPRERRRLRERRGEERKGAEWEESRRRK